MRKLFVLFLTAALVLGLSMEALAASVDLAADKTEVLAGEEVTVTLRLSEAVEHVYMFEYRLFFDPERVSLKESACAVGDACPGAQISTVKKETTGSKRTYVAVNYINPSGNEITLGTGILSSLVFTAGEDAASDSPVSFTLEKYRMRDSSMKAIEDGEPEPAELRVTVRPAAVPLEETEYAVGPLVARSGRGDILSAIPDSLFLVTVPITRTGNSPDSLVLLAAYGEGGRFRGLMYVSLEDVPMGATVKVTLPVDNSDGGIWQLKAFVVSSFGSFVPLGNVSTFGE